MEKITGNYLEGQVLYTRRDIYGWFNRSLSNHIPKNTPCTVIKVYPALYFFSPARYWVEFKTPFDEYGCYTIMHDDLKPAL